MERQKLPVVAWTALIAARKYWRKAYEATNLLSDLRGYTIMSLYTMTPPLRNDFGCVYLIDREPTDKNRNYYWPARGLFYLNHFKTMKRYPDEEPIQFIPKLQRVLKKWIRVSKAKKWLFTNRKGKPYGGCEEDNKANSFAGVVKDVASRYIQKKEEGDPPITINVMRKSKRSDINVKSMGFEENQRVARLMRHNLETANFYYQRTAESDDEDLTDLESELEGE